MEDYIDILLTGFWEQWAKFLSSDYFLAKARMDNAEKALYETLSESQIKLFLSYEEHRNATSAFWETCISRQAFLLAKEIYR